MTPESGCSPDAELLTPQQLGVLDYASAVAAMQAFTATRTPQTPDELWLCQHPPTYTQGLAGLSDHLLAPGTIPVVATNRGGQVTYHGPGQVVAYPLLDLKRAGYFVKEYVYRLEEATLRTLFHFGVVGHRVAGAPGIYVRLDNPRDHSLLPARPQRRTPNPLGAPGRAPDPSFEGLGKIAALGIKVSRNCTYHGAALNVQMDLEPYSRINPCGYADLRTVDLFTMGVNVPAADVSAVWGVQLQRLLLP